MSNRTEGTRRKLSHMPTGRLKPLRLFSTLLAIALKTPLTSGIALIASVDAGRGAIMP